VIATMAGAPIAIERVSHGFGPLRVLDDISLTLAAGERVAVVGPSGCGKSTLLSLVAGLEQPLSGTIAVAGRQEPADRLAGCALMPQDDLLLPWRSAIDNAALPLVNAGLGRREARDLARPLFHRFGLEGFEREQPRWLSGGMRQRVAFLRTLLSGKPVLALDEPFAALDALTRADVQRWLEEALARSPRTVVLVTHDVEEAVVLGDRVVVLSPRPGRVVAGLAVALPRPRRRTDADVVALREQALTALGVSA
jgi:ABC-type nitrate/sulfonate/bicarbonate transport system ATPase subunit